MAKTDGYGGYRGGVSTILHMAAVMVEWVGVWLVKLKEYGGYGGYRGGG